MAYPGLAARLVIAALTMRLFLTATLAVTLGCAHAVPTAEIPIASPSPSATAIATATAPATRTATASTATVNPDPNPTPTANAIPTATASDPPPLDPAREKLVTSAQRWLGKRFRGDCSRFVARVYRDAGVALEFAPPAGTASEALYRASQPVAQPSPGDLAFFHDTHGPVRNRRRPVRLTHVAVVEAVEGPIVSLIHRASRGIERMVMNLEHRHDRDENSVLRRRRAGDPPGLRTLAGELFTAFGSPPALAPEGPERPPLRNRLLHSKVASGP